MGARNQAGLRAGGAMFTPAAGCGVEPGAGAGAGAGIVGGKAQAAGGESFAAGASLPAGSTDVSRMAPATCLGKRSGASCVQGWLQ